MREKFRIAVWSFAKRHDGLFERLCQQHAESRREQRAEQHTYACAALKYAFMVPPEWAHVIGVRREGRAS